MLNKSILLVSDDYETNSIQCLTNISKSYSNSDLNLYSLSSLNTEASDDKLINEFKEIMLNILETEFKPTDTVIVCWSQPARHCIVRNDVPRIDRIGPWSAKVEDTGNPVNRLFRKDGPTRIQEIATSYYKDCYDDVDAKIDMHKNVQFAYLWLKEKVKDQYHFSVHADDTKKHWSTEAWYNVPVLGTDVVAEQKIENALDDGHPNQKGHKVIAQTLYNIIKENRT